MADALYCHLCGRTISGSSKVFRHDEWPLEQTLRVCLDCLQQKPRCRVCSLPLASASPNGLCETCNASAQFCLACGEPVGSERYNFDLLGPYCTRCLEERATCDACCAPLTDETWQLSDGRVMCAYCHSMAIYSPAAANKIYDEMKMVAEKRMGIKLNIPTGLALVDRNQLSEVIRSQIENTQSERLDAEQLDPQRTIGLYARRGIRRGIYIQTGLPRILFLQVAAHEFGHAWQGENCPLIRDELAHEGFAEWVSYHVLGYYGYTLGQERMQARQDIYGKGLAWALDIESSQGMSGVLDACRRSM